MKKIIPLLAIVIVIAGVFLLVKQDTSRPPVMEQVSVEESQQLFKSPLVNYVPADATSVVVCDLKNEAATNYKKSPMLKRLVELFRDPETVSAITSAFMDPSTPENVKAGLEKVQKIISVFQKSNLTDPENIEDYLFYQGNTDAPNKVNSGAFGLLKASANLEQLTTELRALDVPINEEQDGSIKLFSLDVPKLISSIIPDSGQKQDLSAIPIWYWGDSGNRIGVSSDKEDLVGFLKGEKQSEKPKLLTPPGLDKALTEVPFSSSIHICWGITDFTAQLQGMQNLLNQQLEKTKDQDAPKQLPNDFQKIISQVPVETIISRMGYNSGVTAKTVIGFVQKGDAYDLQKWMRPFRQAGDNTVTGIMPASPLIALSFSTKTINALVENILEIRSKEKNSTPLPPEAEEARGLFKKVDQVGVSLGAAQGAPPFGIIPELGLFLASNEPAKIMETIKGLPSKAPDGPAKAMFQDWQTVDIEGQEVFAIYLPMGGLGIFLTTKDDFVIMTSSENDMKAALSRISGGGNSLADNFQKNQPAFAKFFLSLEKASETIDLVVSTVSAMSGKSIQVPNQIKEILALLGNISWNLHAIGDSLHVDVWQQAGKISKDAKEKS